MLFCFVYLLFERSWKFVSILLATAQRIRTKFRAIVFHEFELMLIVSRVRYIYV